MSKGVDSHAFPCFRCGEPVTLGGHHQCPEEPTTECPHCGEEYTGIKHDCEQLPPMADDECPICGEPASSFMSHMSDCPGPPE